MKKLVIAVLASFAVPALAPAAPVLKAGLWEVKQTKQVFDGQDRSAQIAASRARMQQALAGLPAEQRKQMEAMMAGQDPGGAVRVCVSPEMAARDRPVVDPRSHCETDKVSRSGNAMTFEVSCNADGRATTGRGKVVSTGDTVTTEMVMSVSDASGKHTVQSESRMTYLGADCKGVRPADQIEREMAAKRR